MKKGPSEGKAVLSTMKYALGLSFGERESGSSPGLALMSLLENRSLNEGALHLLKLKNGLSCLPPVLFLRFPKGRGRISFFGGFTGC